MSSMNVEIYQAFKEVGATEETAQAAGKAIEVKENRLTTIEGCLTNIEKDLVSMKQDLSSVESRLNRWESNFNKPMTMRDYFGKSLKTEYYYRHPWSYRRRAIYGLDEPSPTVRGVNRPIPSGYKGHSLDATQDFAQVRPLTTKERGQIQTFPPDFKWVGTKTDVEQIIGNAVPVKLAEYVGTILSDYNLEDSVDTTNTTLSQSSESVTKPSVRVLQNHQLSLRLEDFL